MWFWQEEPSFYLKLHFVLGIQLYLIAKISSLWLVELHTTKFWVVKSGDFTQKDESDMPFYLIDRRQTAFWFYLFSFACVLWCNYEMSLTVSWSLLGTAILESDRTWRRKSHPWRKESLREGLKVLKFRIIYCLRSPSWLPAPCDQPFHNSIFSHSTQNAMHPLSNCETQNHCWSPKILFSFFFRNNVKSKATGHN